MLTAKQDLIWEGCTCRPLYKHLCAVNKWVNQWDTVSTFLTACWQPCCNLALQSQLIYVLHTCKRHNDAVNRKLDVHCYYWVIVILSHAAQGSFLNSFLTDSASMDPEQRGRFLEEPPEGAPDIDKAHEVILLCFPPASMLGLQGTSLLPLHWCTRVATTHTCIDAYVAAMHAVQTCAAQSMFTTLGSC